MKIGEKGQTLVETALLLPVLLLFVFGIIDFGRALFTLNTLNNAARAGARKAVVTSVNPAATPSWDRNSIIAVVSDAIILDKTGLTVTVTATPHDPPQAGDTVEVVANLPFEAVVPFAEFAYPETLTGRAFMRFE